MQPQDDNKLLPQHLWLIEESAIGPEVAQARGYRSVTTKAELGRLGFGEKQCRVPALLIPIWNMGGEVVNYQIRPDQPRVSHKGDKVIKYETVQGSRMVLDVPPGARQWIGDPNVPLFIPKGAAVALAYELQGIIAPPAFPKRAERTSARAPVCDVPAASGIPAASRRCRSCPNPRRRR